VRDRIVRWGSSVFIGSTLALLGVSRAESITHSLAPDRPEMLLLGLSVLTLPFALARVVQEGDPKSRRNWALLLGLCVLLVGLVFVLPK
jgi:hypothetical protein